MHLCMHCKYTNRYHMGSSIAVDRQFQRGLVKLMPVTFVMKIKETHSLDLYVILPYINRFRPKINNKQMVDKNGTIIFFSIGQTKMFQVPASSFLRFQEPAVKKNSQKAKIF
jgi:hypothetical protein